MAFYQNQPPSTGYYSTQTPQPIINIPLNPIPNMSSQVILNDPPAIEDVQEIITPLPLPSQLPVISPLKIMGSPNRPTTVQGNAAGIVLSQGNTNGTAPRASFVLPPSVVIRH